MLRSREIRRSDRSPWQTRTILQYFWCVVSSFSLRCLEATKPSRRCRFDQCALIFRYKVCLATCISFLCPPATKWEVKRASAGIRLEKLRVANIEMLICAISLYVSACGWCPFDSKSKETNTTSHTAVSLYKPKTFPSSCKVFRGNKAPFLQRNFFRCWTWLRLDFWYSLSHAISKNAQSCRRVYLGCPLKLSGLGTLQWSKQVANAVLCLPSIILKIQSLTYTEGSDNVWMNYFTLDFERIWMSDYMSELVALKSSLDFGTFVSRPAFFWLWRLPR